MDGTRRTHPMSTSRPKLCIGVPIPAFIILLAVIGTGDYILSGRHLDEVEDLEQEGLTVIADLTVRQIVFRLSDQLKDAEAIQHDNVVDDNATNCLIQRHVLTHWGMKPTDLDSDGLGHVAAGVFKDPGSFAAALRMEHIGQDTDWDHAEEAWVTVNGEMGRLSATLMELAGAPLTADERKLS